MCLLALLTVTLSILMLSGVMYDQFFERMKQDVRMRLCTWLLA